MNASKADPSAEKTKDTAVRAHKTNGTRAPASEGAGAGAGPGAGAGVGAGAVGARGAGVRALLAAHDELATALKGNSALLSKLNNLTHSLTP